jgi:hypothetical protein
MDAPLNDTALTASMEHALPTSKTYALTPFNIAQSLASMGAAQACMKGSRFAAFHLAHFSTAVLATLAAALIVLIATFKLAEAAHLYLY